jgi:hypothetical protein
MPFVVKNVVYVTISFGFSISFFFPLFKSIKFTTKWQKREYITQILVRKPDKTKKEYRYPNQVVLH